MLVCVLISANPRYPVIPIWPSFVLFCALFGFGGALHALQPLVYVYIGYTVSTYMIIEKLTFIV